MISKIKNKKCKSNRELGDLKYQYTFLNNNKYTALVLDVDSGECCAFWKQER